MKTPRSVMQRLSMIEIDIDRLRRAVVVDDVHAAVTECMKAMTKIGKLLIILIDLETKETKND